jgi:small subunit ribosomal protein S9
MMTENETTTAFSSSTPAGATNRAAVIAPGAGVGRRKEAVARVRLVPGSGRWTVNDNLSLNHFAQLALKESMT